MSVLETVNIVETALWPQHDARDPLGVWGARDLISGDASGGVIQSQIQVSAARRAGNVYTCYSAMSVQTGGTSDTATLMRLRLLTNWPDIDRITAGAQGFATWRSSPIEAGFGTDPTGGPANELISPNDRFILLLDPGVVGAGNPMVLVEILRNANVDGATYSFEAYGYYWDRGVLNAPGGPRHPGSS